MWYLGFEQGSVSDTGGKLLALKILDNFKFLAEQWFYFNNMGEKGENLFYQVHIRQVQCL